MFVLIAVGLLIAGLGWAIDNGRVETIGTVLTVAGIALVLVGHHVL
jgi:hypothetical membrane protein